MAVDDLYVPDGVYLKCDQGATIKNLKVSPKKHKLYGEIIATEKDNVPITNIPCFDACSSSGNTCLPKAPQWKKVHEGGTKIEQQKPLLETSYCKCMQGGNIDIFFDEESAVASLESDKNNRVDKIPLLDSIIGFTLSPSVKILGADYSDMGRGFRQGGKKSWNGIKEMVCHPIDTAKGLGNLATTGVIGYSPGSAASILAKPSDVSITDWLTSTPEERLSHFDKEWDTNLSATNQGIKKAASDFWDRKIENGTGAERGVIAGEAAEFIVELVVGTKGAGAAVKGIKGSAAFANLSEKTASAMATINKFVQASKLGKLAESIKGIFKVGRRLKIRGVTFEDFVKSCKFPSDDIANQAWDLFRNKDWKGLEDLFNKHKLNDGWPPNRGASSLEKTTLKPGDTFDRYGGWVDENGFHDKGTFAGKEGTPYSERALPKGTDGKPYKKYEVIKEIPEVNKGEVIPWFGEKGGGIQYELPVSVDDLIKEGYIKPIS